MPKHDKKLCIKCNSYSKCDKHDNLPCPCCNKDNCYNNCNHCYFDKQGNCVHHLSDDEMQTAYARLIFDLEGPDDDDMYAKHISTLKRLSLEIRINKLQEIHQNVYDDGNAHKMPSLQKLLELNLEIAKLVDTGIAFKDASVTVLENEARRSPGHTRAMMPLLLKAYQEADKPCDSP